jgi:predicted DsbA family dithiol-disulfide isomerase
LKKFGSMERSRQLEQQLADVGRHVGISFRYDLMTRISNTRRAHALLALALKESMETQNNTAERLFAGYFQRGEDPGDSTTLMNIAEEMGIKSVTGPQVFDDPALQDAIRKEEEQAYAKGVSGVPSMFYGGQLVASGAQPEQIIADALRSITVS